MHSNFYEVRISKIDPVVTRAPPGMQNISLLLEYWVLSLNKILRHVDTDRSTVYRRKQAQGAIKSKSAQAVPISTTADIGK